jgi:hypothetical protein
MDLSTLKEFHPLLIGKTVRIKKHYEYAGSKAVIKSHDSLGCYVEVDGRKTLKLDYSDLEALKVVSDWDKKEFAEWCKDHKKMLELAKKDKGKNPAGAIDDVVRALKPYINSFDYAEFCDNLAQMMNDRFGTIQIDLIYEMAQEMIKSE